MKEKFVVARDFRGKPMKRAALEVGNGLVYLAHPDRLEAIAQGKSSPVGFRRKTFSPMKIGLLKFFARLMRLGVWSQRVGVD